MMNGARSIRAKIAARNSTRKGMHDTRLKHPPIFRLFSKIEYKDNCIIDLQNKTITTNKWKVK